MRFPICRFLNKDDCCLGRGGLNETFTAKLKCIQRFELYWYKKFNLFGLVEKSLWLFLLEMSSHFHILIGPNFHPADWWISLGGLEALGLLLFLFGDAWISPEFHLLHEIPAKMGSLNHLLHLSFGKHFLTHQKAYCELRLKFKFTWAPELSTSKRFITPPAAKVFLSVIVIKVI